MNSYQANYLLCALPILIIIAAVGIHRGWRVLRYDERSLNLIQRTIIWYTRWLKGDELADHFHEQMMNNPAKIRWAAWNDVIGGIIAIIICIIGIILVIQLTS